MIAPFLFVRRSWSRVALGGSLGLIFAVPGPCTLFDGSDSAATTPSDSGDQPPPGDGGGDGGSGQSLVDGASCGLDFDGLPAPCMTALNQGCCGIIGSCSTTPRCAAYVACVNACSIPRASTCVDACRTDGSVPVSFAAVQSCFTSYEKESDLGVDCVWP